MCKGGSYIQIGNGVAQFLVGLACNGSSTLPCTNMPIYIIASTETGSENSILDPSSHAQLVAASGFCSLLSVENGGPFWRQRITHIVLPIVMDACKKQALSQNPPALGLLAVVCHIVCCIPLQILGEQSTKDLTPTLVGGLVYFTKNVASLQKSERISSKANDLLTSLHFCARGCNHPSCAWDYDHPYFLCTEP